MLFVVASLFADSVNLGDGSTASGLESVAIGNQSTASGITAVAVGNYSSATNERASAFGNRSTASGVGSTALGDWSEASANGATALGASSTASGVGSLALGYNARALGVGSVALGDNAVATEDYTVSVGSVGNYRRIVNVADPINSYDAVNLNYLLTNYYTKTQIDTLLSGLSGGVVDLSSAYAYTDATAQTTLNQSRAYTDQQIAETKKEARAGVALALALSTPLDFSNGKNALNIGTGYYKGESAIGLNFGRKVNDYTHYTLGVASNSRDNAFKASVGFSW